MTRVEVITASAGDQDAVLGILRSAGTAGPGTRASTWGHEFPDVIRDLPAGLVHLARLAGRPVATFVLRWSDERVWGPDDGEAGYLHRLATHPDVGGRGIGAQLIAVASGLTRERGRRWLRLDCDRDNERLRGLLRGPGLRARRRRGQPAAQHAARLPGGQPLSAGNKRLALLVAPTGQAARPGHPGRPEIVRAPG